MEAAEEEEQMYRVVKNDLDNLISSILEQDQEEDTDEINVFNTQVRQIERKQREINKIFLECQDHLDKYRETLRLEQEDEDEKQKEAEAAVAEAQETERKQQLREAQEAAEVLDLVEDSDDDIEIIGSSFDPNVAANRKAIIKAHMAARPAAKQPVKPAEASVPQPETTTLTQNVIAPGTAGVSGQVSVAHLRAILTEAINKQMPGSQAHAQSQAQLLQLQQQAQKGELSPLQKQLNTDVTYTVARTGPVAILPKVSTKPKNSSSSQDWKEVDISAKVLAKKFNDIWYSGTITDIVNKLDPPDVRKYKVKFDGKGMKILSGKHIAYRDPIHVVLKVGSRCVALYRDDEANGPNSFYAGIVAEAPSVKNQKRYLIFFDDGYAQYCYPKEIHKVCHQSDNVWEDIHPDSQEFIKEYLKQYPERPMVRLLKGQVVRTEWNGKWWTAKVMEVDASLVKMFFQADKRTESIYRGSTRLEPLFKALANAEAIKAAGNNKARRHNLDPKANRKPLVEYTRGVSEENSNKSMIKQPPATPPTATPPPSIAPTPPPPQVLGPGYNQNHPAVQAYLQAREAGTQRAQLATTISVTGGEHKKRPVAKKSTGSRPLPVPPPVTTSAWEAPWLKLPKRGGTTTVTVTPAPVPKTTMPQVSAADNEMRKAFYQASSISSNTVAQDMASVLQERLKTVDEADIDEEALGERMDTMLDLKEKIRKKFIPHCCGKKCKKNNDEELEKLKGRSTLLKPLLCGWERHVCKLRPSGRRVVMYQGPCQRRLRCIEEVDLYLCVTDSPLTIDLFCFDPVLHVHTEFVPVKTFCDIKDLSYGKEAVPISCINGIDRQYPDYVEYSNQRIPAQGVKLNLDSDFLMCCDCTDNCRDKSKCQCCQLTIEHTEALGPNYRDPSAGYEFRRLKEPIFTGIFECNPRCKCDSRCHNRLAQNGLNLRLQVFKTEKRGWGLRCLDDIPKGGFICIYAGQLLTEGGANEDGKQYGDEYLAELDFIEVVERQKEGYESDVEEDQGIGGDDDEDAEEEGDEAVTSDTSDSDFAGEGNDQTVEHKEHATRKRNKTSKLESQSSIESSDRKDEKLKKIVIKRDTAASGDNKEWYEKKTAAWVDSISTDPISTDSISDPIMIDDEEEASAPVNKPEKKEPMDFDELPDLDLPVEKKPVVKEVMPDKPKPRLARKSTTTAHSESKHPDVDEKKIITGLLISNTKEESDSETEPQKNEKLLGRARKSTGGSRFKNLPNPRAQMGRKGDDSKTRERREGQDQRPGTRFYFRDGQTCYIMDAKSMGNIGRYLNHSCSPNVFVQNVFVDTQDLRFPWVAFFAGQYIRAGTELTWDYNYEVGSVPDKVLYCYCGSSQCRGRLL
ncbi:histone-lysine N-methyltransferase eggless-like isoform X2 [Haliotis rufescens]|uniref:histone-lysine N-methyltransferase eggless-like isoform X2 n=1 Tax=Haliotis rufescens TaxID=6454 RepID=UPI00201EA07C|nr:histone-lysine N-methyltransferase eggless-like isoform X2 [Haliotis rufescens]